MRLSNRTLRHLGLEGAHYLEIIGYHEITKFQSALTKKQTNKKQQKQTNINKNTTKNKQANKTKNNNNQ